MGEFDGKIPEVVQPTRDHVGFKSFEGKHVDVEAAQVLDSKKLISEIGARTGRDDAEWLEAVATINGITAEQVKVFTTEYEADVRDNNIDPDTSIEKYIQEKLK